MTQAAADAQALLLQHARRAPALARTAIDEVRRTHGLLDVPTFLSPVVLPAHARAELARTAALLHGALSRVQRAFFNESRFADVLELPDGLAALTGPVAGDPTLISARFDLVAHPSLESGFTVVEVQAGDPSGSGWTDLLWEGLAETPGTRALRERFDVEAPALITQQRRAALEVYATWCEAHDQVLQPKPRVAFACAHDSIVRSDHEAYATLWRRAGFDAHVADPRDLVVRGDRLLADGAQIDLLVRDTHDELITPAFVDETTELRSLLARDGVCCLNPLRDALLDDKCGFEVLTDPRHSAFFSEEERAVIAAHVPRTRRLTHANADDVRANREQLVLKPADGYGGSNVVLGPFVDDEAWRRAVAAGLRQRTVVQAYAPMPRWAVPDLSGEIAEHYCALSLWVHGGRFSGAYARLSAEPIVNVHRGGGIVPAVFVTARTGARRP